MPLDLDAVTIHHNEADARYEAHLPDDAVARADYIRLTRKVIFTHTEVPDAYEGQGVGEKLVRHALDDVRAQGDVKVVALCPFVKAFIARHEEYQDLT